LVTFPYVVGDPHLRFYCGMPLALNRASSRRSGIDDLGAADRRGAHGDLAGKSGHVRRHAVLCLEPLALLVDEADVADGTSADLRRQFRDLVVGGVGRGVEDVERAQRR
jgi:hypothetical protein